MTVGLAAARGWSCCCGEGCGEEDAAEICFGLRLCEWPAARYGGGRRHQLAIRAGVREVWLARGAVVGMAS